MNGGLDVAVVQFAPHTDKEANLSELAGHVRAAAARGARVVLAPEYSMFGIGRLDQRMAEAAEQLDGPFVGGLCELSKELGVHVIAGMAERLPGADRIANTLVAAGPAG